MNFEINKYLIDLAKIFLPYAKLYIVGGFVRNSLLNKKSNDIDLTSCLTLDEVEKIIKNTNYKLKITNKTLGTAKIVYDKFCYEYTTFRKDFYTNGKHFPQKVEIVKTIEEDFVRRDFTVNAIYFDILENKLCDPANGIYDINNRLLRIVTPTTLNFDGERILRLVKYCCLLNFKIEKQTFKLAKQNNKNVYSLSENMIKLYSNFFNSLNFFKKIKAKRILKKMGLTTLI